MQKNNLKIGGALRAYSILVPAAVLAPRKFLGALAHRRPYPLRNEHEMNSWCFIRNAVTGPYPTTPHSPGLCVRLFRPHPTLTLSPRSQSFPSGASGISISERRAVGGLCIFHLLVLVVYIRMVHGYHLTRTVTRLNFTRRPYHYVV